jgi:ribosomal protein S18 acetylase RimI-like enzyme
MSKRLTTSKGVIAIRPAVAADAVALRDLRLEGLANHPLAFAADYERTKAEPAELWAERMCDYAASNKGVICVAATNDRLIGMNGLGCEKWPKTRHSGVLWGVYVQKEWRGLGVAEGLLNECIAWGQAHGLAIVKLGVVTTNVPAIRCYARCGFTVYGIDPKVIYYKNAFHDELLMARTI